MDPQAEASLVNWYYAPTLGLSNGANVTSWTDDKTGNPNPLSAGGNYPVYATNQQNSKATVSFTAASFHALSNGGSTASSYSRTFAGVARVANTSAAYTIIGPSGTGGLQLVISSGGALTLNKAQTAVIGSSSSNVPTGSYFSFIACVNSTDYLFEISGASAGSGTHSQTLTGARTFRMWTNVSSEYFNGHLAELLIFSSFFDSSKRASCHAYLANGWAVS